MEGKSKSSDHSIFAKRADPSVKLSTEAESCDTLKVTYSNFITTMKGYVKLGTNDEENARIEEENLGYFGKIKRNFMKAIEVEKSYSVFFIILAVGIGLICLSMLFLPMAWLSPRKFVSFFSLGSFVTLISFIFIYGTSAYLEMLFSKTRAMFSILFILSIFLGVYFTFNETYYLISLICAVIQLITLIVFTLSFIPGGRYGISIITSMLMSPVNSVWNRIKGKA